MFLRWVDSGLVRELKGHVGAVQAVAFSQDGRSVVSGGLDGTVGIWPLPPNDRVEFRDWLAARTPYRIKDYEPKPLRDLPPLDAVVLDR